MHLQTACRRGRQDTPPPCRKPAVAPDVQDRVRLAQSASHIVRDHDDRHLLFFVEVAQGLIEILRGGGVETRDRLVQNEQAVRRAQGAREQHALLLSAGKLAVAAVLQLQHAELAHVHQRRALLRGGVEKVQPALVGKAREHDLAHRSGKIALRARLLRKVADGARALRGAVDRAGERRDQPEQAFHQRRLAAAVLAHHAEVIPRADGKRQMLEQRAVLVAEACVTACKQNIPVHHSKPPFKAS